MDTDPTTTLIKQWRSNSKQHTSRLKSVNRSKCFDGQRQLHVGMAAAYASCADQLEALTAESVPPALPATPVWIGVDMAAPGATDMSTPNE